MQNTLFYFVLYTETFSISSFFWVTIKFFNMTNFFPSHFLYNSTVYPKTFFSYANFIIKLHSFPTGPIFCVKNLNVLLIFWILAKAITNIHI